MPFDMVINVWLSNLADMATAAKLLQEAGLEFRCCPDIDALIAQAPREAGALLLEEEGLSAPALEKLRGALSGQPPWSALPVILLVKRSGSTVPRKPWAQWIGNLTVVDRPVTSLALVTVLKMALQSRRQQYEVRDLLANLQELNRSLEQRVAERTEQLKRSNMDLEQFAHVASHDLQEPLRMVASFLSLLRDHSQDQLDDKDKEYIAFACDGANRMKALVSDLLEYCSARGRELVLEPAILQAILGTVLINLKIRIEDSGAIITHDPLPTIMADVHLIERVLQNLICNALKFRSPERPVEVHIGARRVPGAPWKDVPDDASAANAFWLFFVRDNGIGLDPHFHDRIFQIFQRQHGRDKYEGTGIGLAICQNIIQRHGGRIWVESEPGKGATFFFTLPGE